MDPSQKKPRVNASMLQRLHGAPVCLLGLAHTPSSDGMSFKITSSDKKDVTINMQEPLQEYVNGLTEIHGVVQPNNSILCNDVVTALENADTFDMESYDKAVILMNQYPDHYICGNPAA